MVGRIGVGGENPIRIQSMTTTPTRDVTATVDQIMQLSDAGCEIVRVTVQGKKEAQSCEAIKNALIQRGYLIPLVADIHFYPPAALIVADFADKVRINPGNFYDARAQFKTFEYDDFSYAAEMAKIEETFAPLVEKCKRLKKPIRIGTNHGSLSDRIMNRYGDSPAGMVESALEYTRICRKMDFHDLIFSMKASNPTVMIQAYRLLAGEMLKLGWDYPFHLGVTEAGAGEEGRVKSAMGIGALLMDGLGDTIRVSLTEDPINEIAPSRQLIAFFEERKNKGIEPFEERQRSTTRKTTPAFHPDGSVILRQHLNETIPSDPRPDGLWDSSAFVLKEGLLPSGVSPKFIIFQPSKSPIHETRRLIDDLKKRDLAIPVILCLSYLGPWDDVIIQAGAEAGALLCDRLIDGICIEANEAAEKRVRLGFTLLQAARMRMTKTEFISCPGCGRTLFDLQTVARTIREKTGHLPGVKIAIMGCVVNGPGEMADADFGYVGSKIGKIDLYVGKKCVEREVDMVKAADRLIDLIASHGKWIDPVKKS